MNKIYRVVFNQSTQTFQAVCENAKSQGKCSSTVKKSSTPVKILTLSALAASVILSIPNAVAQLTPVPPPVNTTTPNPINTYFFACITNTGQGSAGNGVDYDWLKAVCGENNDAYKNSMIYAFDPVHGRTSLGFGAWADREYATAIGYATKANAKYSTAVGSNAIADGEYASVFGYLAKATGEQSSAFGYYSNAVGYSTAFGAFSEALGVQATAIGYVATAKGSSAALGSYAEAKGEESVAIGGSVRAEGFRSIGIGRFSTVEGDWSGAFGSSSFIRGARSYTSGKSNIVGAGADDAGAFGNDNQIGAITAFGGNGLPNDPVTLTDEVNASGSRVVGNYNIITSPNTYVLGSGINSKDQHTKIGETVANSVYLGDDSTVTAGNEENKSYKNALKDSTDEGETTTGGATGTVRNATINDITYGEFAGKTAVGAVSVGASGYERRIQNVAAGEISSTSTDAINGSQLYQIANQITQKVKDIQSYVHVNDGTDTQEAGDPNTNHGSIKSKGGALGRNSLAAGIRAKATAQHSTALGELAEATKQGAVALGANSLADRAGLPEGTTTASTTPDAAQNSVYSPTDTDNTAILATVKGTENGAVSVGATDETTRQIINVAAGSADSDAVNVAQLKAVAKLASPAKYFADKDKAADIATQATEKDKAKTMTDGVLGIKGTNTTAQTGTDDTTAKTRADTKNITTTIDTASNTVSVELSSHIKGLSSLQFDAKQGIKIGDQNTSAVDKDIAIGNGATVVKGSTIGLGARKNPAYDLDINKVAPTLEKPNLGKIYSIAQGVALGEKAAAGNGSTALGGYTYATGSQATAVGSMSTATGGNAVALGAAAQAMGNSDISIGRESVAKENFTIAIGNVASATADGAFAVGHSAQATGKRTIAIGAVETDSKNTNGVHNPNGTRATADDAIALGTGTEASSENTIAIGTGAKATGKQSISIGTGNQVTGNYSGAFGDPSIISGAGSYTMGNDNGVAFGTNNVGAFGNNNQLGGTATYDQNGKLTTATGVTPNISATGSRVIGNNNAVNSQNTFVLGNGINTAADGKTLLGNTVANSVYLGNDSSVRADKGKNHQLDSDVEGYTTTGGAKGTVESAIINGVTYTGFKGASAVGAVSVGASGYERRIQNVAAGEISSTSTDAINGSQLYQIANQITQKVKDIQSYVHVNDGTDTQEAGDPDTNKGSIKSKGGALGRNSLAAGIGAKANGENSIALGTDAATNEYGSVAIGEGAKSTELGAIAIGQAANSSESGSISIGTYTSSNDVDAITIGSYNRIEGNGSIGLGRGIHIVDEARINNTSSRFSNVIAIGDDSTISARFAGTIGTQNTIAYKDPNKQEVLDSYVLGNGNAVNTSHTFVLGSNINASESCIKVRQQGRFDFDSCSKGDTVENSVYLGYKTTVTDGQGGQGTLFNNDISGKAGTTTTGGAKGTVSNAVINGVAYGDFAGKTAVGAVSVGASGYERRIQNVAAGEISSTSTDAINGSQLYQITSRMTQQIGDSAWKLAAGADTDSENIQAGKTVTFKAGESQNLTVKRDGANIVYDLAKNLTADSLKVGDSTVNVAGVTINNGTAGQPVKLTKDGLDNGGNTITNIADGKNDTDAVNVKQLRQAVASQSVVSSDKTVKVNSKRTNTGGTEFDVSVNTGNTLTVGKDGALNVNVDNRTVKINSDGQLYADIVDTNTITSLTNGNYTTATNTGTAAAPVYKVDVNTSAITTKTNGSVAAPTIDGVATSKNVADAINQSGFNLTSSNDGVSTGVTDLVNPSETVTIDGAKNITVSQTGSTISIATKDEVKFNSVQLGNNGPKITSHDGSIKVAASNGEAAKITNVKAGVNDTDAVNVAQLKKAIGGATTQIAEGKNVIVKNEKGVDGQAVYTVHADSSKVTQGDGITVKHTATTDKNGVTTNSYNVALSEATKKQLNKEESVTSQDTNLLVDNTTTNETGAKEYKLSLNKNLDLTENGLITIGDSKLNKEGLAIEGGPTVKKSGIDAGSKKITNVEDGEIRAGSKDAVNGGQLRRELDNIGWDLAVGGNTAKDSEQGSKKVKNKGKVTVSGGKNMVVSRKDSTIELATSSTPEFDSVKVGNTTISSSIAQDGVNEVNLVGANNAPTRITNVAPGVKGTDAVNVNQLKGAVSHLDNKINRNNRNLRAGIAGANAAAGLPQVYIPGKSMIAASAGTFKGENAVAVGYSRSSDNGKVILKLQGNANTIGDFGGSMGIGYQW
ncbi:ESPR-type extended signal peptide-containing protein [Mannheimia pernigra]|uniref:YadA-like family protein n=1 Tax=Mannheimia pernigra TaxID=111844 RepID=A0A7D5E0C1_9PAST|nr:YadA-like family protein [Mannheimia pernigra]QLB40002.1 YadA-like family protein [Mannheimia pernigra]